VEQHFDFYERPNLHLAVEELLEKPQSKAELIGVVVPEEYHSITLSKLSRPAAEDACDGALVVREQHIDEALTELLVAGGPLTQSLLGAMPQDRVHP
jgi:hypothetical protein